MADGSSPRHVGRSLLTQWWRDVTFLHWRADPRSVEHLLSAGTRPDVIDGSTFVGLVCFRLHVLGWPPLADLWAFPETNVRLYTIDGRQRRAVVFLSMDASDATFVVGSRASVRLPYMWSEMSVVRAGDEISYTCRRRWPRSRAATSRLTVRPGARIAQPSPLERFLTERWGLHTSWGGRTAYLPNDHAPWDLHRADLVRCEDGLVAAAGVPVVGEPVSVLHSPGVRARFGTPSVTVR